jgi:hypothetical protein
MTKRENSAMVGTMVPMRHGMDWEFRMIFR